jgi:hypothetical protein
VTLALTPIGVVAVSSGWNAWKVQFSWDDVADLGFEGPDEVKFTHNHRIDMNGSAMVVTLFFGGWRGPWLPPVVWFAVKTFVLVCGFILVRATLPRPRFDQLMAYGWKVMLPLALVNLVVTGAIVVARG